MRILCCFKLSPDYDKVLDRDWAAAQFPLSDISYVPRGLGCYDEAALEAALRLRDEALARGQAAELTAATVSCEAIDAFARRLYALGVQRVVQIKTCAAADFQPEKVSLALAAVFSNEPFSAVLCGIQSAEGCGMTPYRLAQKLGMPCFSNVTALALCEGGLRVTCESSGGARCASVRTPAVYAIGNSAQPYLRMATIRQRMAVANRLPEVRTISLPDTEETISLLHVSRPVSGRRCVFVTGDSCTKQAETFLNMCPEVKHK